LFRGREKLKLLLDAWTALELNLKDRAGTPRYRVRPDGELLPPTHSRPSIV